MSDYFARLLAAWARDVLAEWLPGYHEDQVSLPWRVVAMEGEGLFAIQTADLRRCEQGRYRVTVTVERQELEDGS